MSTSSQQIGLACAGGALEGAAYEIGALCAMDEVMDGVSFEKLDVYVGVSAGAFITACLANNISPATMAKAFISKTDGVLPILPKTFFEPALKEYQKRMFKLPGLIGSALWDYLSDPFDISFGGSLYQLTSALPVGLFDNESLRRYLHENFTMNGRTDRFSQLSATLRVIATNLENGEIARFGEPPFDHVPISKAVQASTALPLLYVPVEIDNEYYIDGVARRTVHASTALEEGAGLVFCINPIVPVNDKQRRQLTDAIDQKILDLGLPSVLSQTFRTMIYSRMIAGFKNYEYTYPDADFVVIEPRPDDFRMFYTNIFSFTNRKEVLEYAYQTTRRTLLEQADELEPKLAKYNITLRRDILNDEDQVLYKPRADADAPTGGRETAANIHQVLDRLDKLIDDF